MPTCPSCKAKFGEEEKEKPKRSVGLWPFDEEEEIPEEECGECKAKKNKGAKGEKGEKGDRGDKGEAGQAGSAS